MHLWDLVIFYFTIFSSPYFHLLFIKFTRLIYSILVVVILIAFTYRREVIRTPVVGKSSWYPYRKLIALIIITVGPIIVVNTVIAERYSQSPMEQIAFGKKNDQPLQESHGYRDLCKLYPDSIELQLKYMDILIDVHNYYYQNFTFDYQFKKPETLPLLKAYAQIVSKTTTYDEDPTLLLAIPENTPFVNYMIALKGAKERSLPPQEIENHLWKEIKINPTSGRAPRLLYNMYVYLNNAKLDVLMHDSRITRFLKPRVKNDYYFTHGNTGLYAQNILESRFGNVEWLTFLAALLVSLVWVIFVRTMDVFNREKWWPIGLVFLAGAVFTHFCLPLYDFAQLNLHFVINGDIKNDFLYCFAVIGGSEELVKLIPWVVFASFSKRMKEPYDYLLYAAVAALGFSFTENLRYLEDSGNIVTRTITSSFEHLFFASIVAYSFILAKYRYKKSIWKIIVPIIGFILAAFAHGFYDFWLINETVKDYSFVTIIFFIGTIHIWFFFKNNALNNSGYFSSHQAYNAHFQQDLLTFSLLTILMVEFVFISLEFGADDANEMIHGKAVGIYLFLIYMSILLERIDLKQGVWNNYRLHLPAFSLFMFQLPAFNKKQNEESSNFVGLKLRLTTEVTNKYIGDKLPVTGQCIRKITVSNDPNWYLFQLDARLHYNNYASSCIILKNKKENQLLSESKIEIYFMFIPDIFLLESKDLDIKQLRYAGLVYSEPLY